MDVQDEEEVIDRKCLGEVTGWFMRRAQSPFGYFSHMKTSAATQVSELP